MDLTVYIQLIFLCVVNIIFTFSGIVLNTLAIISFWKSSQLRKKLCHFMIIVLSCFDLLAVVTNHSGMLVYIICWLRGICTSSFTERMGIYLDISGTFLTFSHLALLVMSTERYLAVYYPIFHRTSVTRRRLLTLLAILLIPITVIHIISRNGLAVIASVILLLISLALFLLPFIFFNLKLFIIARKVHRERAASPEKRTTVNLQNISIALWVVACLMLLYIPTSFNIAFNLAEKSANTIRLSYIWSYTCITMNCSLNSLIFFWKNKVLRIEGIKILKALKDRVVGS